MTAVPAPSALREHRPGVWIEESWLRFVGMTLQTRMVVLRVGDGLLLYSPTPANPAEETLSELTARGTPRWLVAPNEIHNVGLPSFQRAFPEVHTTGCVGHPARAPDVRFDVLLDPGSPADAVPWTASGEVRFHVIGGNFFLHEIALFHVASRTLVVADAIEHIGAPQLAGKLPGRLTRWGMRMTGLRLGEYCMSPEHVIYGADADALETSLAVLDGWPFDSLVMCHGRIAEGEAAHAALRSAFRTTIRRVRSRGPIARGFWRLASRFQ